VGVAVLPALRTRYLQHFLRVGRKLGLIIVDHDDFAHAAALNLVSTYSVGFFACGARGTPAATSGITIKQIALCSWIVPRPAEWHSTQQRSRHQFTSDNAASRKLFRMPGRRQEGRELRK